MRYVSPEAFTILAANNADDYVYLCDTLETWGASFRLARGRWNGILERSVVVFGLDPRLVGDLAIALGQQAFMYITGNDAHATR